MNIFFILLFFSGTLAAEINFSSTPVDPPQHAEVTDNNQLKLRMAIELIEKTENGAALKPLIDELLEQDKIQVTSLRPGHYGESGEGCIVKKGQYMYEGYFILLNDSQTPAELASSLVHEVTHYRMIKSHVSLNFNFPVKVVDFEIAAFAKQYEFISELEQLKLVDSQQMFVNEAETVNEIMLNAYKLKMHWSDNDYKKVFDLLVDYGYPITELSRTISQRNQEHCFGMAN